MMISNEQGLYSNQKRKTDFVLDHEEFKEWAKEKGLEHFTNQTEPAFRNQRPGNNKRNNEIPWKERMSSQGT